MFYKTQENAIYANNRARQSDMKHTKNDKRLCRIDNHVCFYPGNYLIDEGETIGLAKQKVLTK